MFKFKSLRGFYFTVFISLLMLFLPSTNVFAGDERVRDRVEAGSQASFNLVKATQKALTEREYNPGPVDGLMGPKTMAALKEYQMDNNLEPSGHPDTETLKSLDLMD